VTLPKITSKVDVETLVDVFEVLEDRLDLDAGALKVEFMVEDDAEHLRPGGAGRSCRACTAPRRAASPARTSGRTTTRRNCDITAAHQKMRHPACDFAKHVMKGVVRGHRRDAVRTARRTSCQSPCTGGRPHGPPEARQPERRVLPRGACTPTTCATRSSTASTRAGISTPGSSRPATARSTRSSSTGSHPRPIA